MQIDVKNEKLIPLAAARSLSWLPGGGVSLGRIHRWVQDGIKGIKLETVSVGGTKCTTEAAMLRFFEKLNAPAPTAPPPTETSVKSGIKRAEAILDAAGI